MKAAVLLGFAIASCSFLGSCDDKKELSPASPASVEDKAEPEFSLADTAWKYMELPYAERFSAPGDEALAVGVHVYAADEMLYRDPLLEHRKGLLERHRLQHMVEDLGCRLGDPNEFVPYASHCAGTPLKALQQEDLPNAIREHVEHIVTNMPADKHVLNQFTPTLYIIADARASFEKIFRVIEAGNSAGISHLAFVVQPFEVPAPEEQGGSLLEMIGGAPRDSDAEMRPVYGVIPCKLPSLSDAMSNNKPLEIQINSDNSVYVEDATGADFFMAPSMETLLHPADAGFAEQRHMVHLEDFLQRRYPDAEIATQPIIVSVAAKAKYQRLLDVLYALNKLGVKTVSFSFCLGN